ncbi:LacI family DNA-binding transcriptional regulator [Paenibacillus sp.]|uniref:LacI family DNA-binding transcriptional regulator n=1 Tax=Paenibacillus sp. TaxID=58172 RepID=UPI002D337AF5|nr:LacI family DNA-binding transcriptional regulator [Paenibacillus sp.]HZG54919.1 LacI family DNA-binding transcriptional regulator [Paenibacillus sp.]
MNVTIKDIARLAGVSYSTVSKALNGSPLVKSETRDRIVELAEQLGYEPNLAAKSLVSRRSMTVGVLLPSLERVALSALVGRINDALADRGYEVILSILPPTSAVRLFQRLQVDGIIVFEDITPEAAHVEPVSTDIPVVSIGVSHLVGSRFAVVDVRRKEALRAAVTYLAGLGHTRIAYIGDARESDAKQQEKVAGFTEGAFACGLSSADAIVLNSDGNTWRHGFEAGRRLLSLDRRPTAVITGAYDVTAGLLRAALDGGLHVPNDLSLVSYDHIPQLAELDVPVTAVGAPVDRFAERIAEALLELLAADGPARRESLLDAVLEERASARRLGG